MTFKAIAAMAANRVIGNNNKLPWRLPEDFKWFKKQTSGQHLIMGRKTFDNVSLLTNRIIWVMTKNNPYGWNDVRNDKGHIQAIVVSSMEELDPNLTYWVCGGAEIYKIFLPKISEFYVTEIKKEYEGDAVMPAFEEQFKNKELLSENEDFKIFKYYERN